MSVVEVYIREPAPADGGRVRFGDARRACHIRTRLPYAESELRWKIRDFCFLSGPSASLFLSIIRPVCSHPCASAPEDTPRGQRANICRTESSPYARACTVARPRGHQIHTDPARCGCRRHIATLAPDLVPRPDADRAASFPWRTASRLYRPARSHGQPSLGAAPRTSWPPTYLLAGHTSMSVISRGNLPRLLATCC